MYTKRQEAWVNKPAVPSLIDADVANWWEAGIYGAHVGLAAHALDPRDYGAKCDGVTADDTTGDRAASNVTQTDAIDTNLRMTFSLIICVAA